MPTSHGADAASLCSRPVSDLWLNLGSGPVAQPGWVSIDRSPNLVLQRLPGVKRALHKAGLLNDAHMAHWSPDIKRIDMTKGLPYPDRSVAAIYSSHAFEHIYLDEVRRILAECHRVLRPGGVIRLALPDGEQWARDLLAGIHEPGEPPGLTYNMRLGSHTTTRPAGVRKLIGAAGGHLHRWQPTRDLVRELLAENGFTDVVEREFQRGELPDIDRIETRPESFFFEAKA